MTASSPGTGLMQSTGQTGTQLASVQQFCVITKAIDPDQDSFF
ncbi:hypothetical protein L837_3603 [Mycobacterium avium MAV_061107_1842]|uniref:Uncharacterized protein n=1 Tax=Mycobacterium avium (strain 104) TaxID=243243 RepID=A0A0H3A403_MYCA1|nr:hypothetical protein MAV_5073 [Mycobacterium avium 104]ETZ43485.1 hypothetical protein L837_3603 [Mycobacterium avium MAV_061107_1842]